MKKVVFVAVLLTGLLIIGNANASIVTFDDISTGQIPSGYAGLTWGTSTIDSYNGNTGYWSVNSGSYAIPHSGSQFVFNTWGPNNLSFSFSSPTLFNGAWFATAGSDPNNQATQVRLSDNLGNVTGWLPLQSAPQFLTANFSGSTTIYVERQGAANDSNGAWYTMDDVTYNGRASVPLPASLLLFAPAMAGLAVIRRRFKN